MLSGNNELEIKQIIENKGKDGWLRVQECAKEFAKDPTTKRFNNSRRTKFYRIRKQIEKGRVEGLKVLLLPGNVSYIGLSSADPEAIERLISKDKKTSRNVKTGLGFFDWLEQRAERKHQERELELSRSEKRISRLEREDAAETEIMMLLENDPEFVKKRNEIYKKYGLL